MLYSSNISSSVNATTNFEVYVAKADFKFNAAHFVAYRGFRERLHGHNYTVGVRLLGSNRISHDGYVLDFGDVKAVVKKVCKALNERFLCPTKSDVVDIKIVRQDSIITDSSTIGSNGSQSDELKSVILTCEDGGRFVIPLDDCAMLPIVHATVEELAIYVWSEILNGLGAKILRNRGIHTMEVVMAEAPGQEAVFRYEVPETTATENEDDRQGLDVLDFIIRSDLTPKPCLNQEQPSSRTEITSNKMNEILTNSNDKTTDSTSTNNKDDCCSDSSCDKFAFFNQLEQIASALNKSQLSDNVNKISSGRGKITADDLISMLDEKNTP